MHNHTLQLKIFILFFGKDNKRFFFRDDETTFRTTKYLSTHPHSTNPKRFRG